MVAATTYEPVPIERWGKDHWTTLLYVETRVVDHHGWVAGQHMRTNMARHPRFDGWMREDGRVVRPTVHSPGDGSQYPTRLRDDEELTDHDDWDCLHDMREAGLLRILSPRDRAWWDVPRGRRGPLGRSISGLKMLRCRVRLTEQGWAMVAALREQRGKTGGVGSFDPAAVT